MTKATLRFLSISHAIRHITFVERMIGNAIPIKEKKAVRSGEIYHAGKDSKSIRTDTMLTARKIVFNNFLNMMI